VSLTNAVKVLKQSEAYLKSSNIAASIGSKDHLKSMANNNQELTFLTTVVIKQSTLSQKLAVLYLNRLIQSKLDEKDKTKKGVFKTSVSTNGRIYKPYCYNFSF